MAEKQMVGKYQIIGKIGEGGMGNIFKAIHPTLKRAIIIKQLRITSEKSLNERFKREARIMMDLRHDNIVQVYDHFREGSSYYIAMEYVDGISLEKLIKHKGTIAPMASLLILQEVAKGLKHAHDKGVIHRDIKPDNVLISKHGEVKLVDFGIATAREENEQDLTKTGAVIGTPAYMSPEQLSSAKTVDKRSDIYSLGVMFYKMMTGARPFPSAFTAEAMNSITKGIYIKPDKVNPDIPRISRYIIRKTMNNKIKKRFRDLRVLLKLLGHYTFKYKDEASVEHAIKNYVKEPVVGKAELDQVRVRKRRHKTMRVVFSLLFLVLAGLGLFIAYDRGYYHEYFLPKKYGSVEVIVDVPEKYYKSRDDVYAIARFFNNDVRGMEFRFKLNPPLSDLSPMILIDSILKKQKPKQSNFLTTEVKYLPSGNYTLELLSENEKLVESIHLFPREIQKQKEKTSKGLIFRLDLADLQPHPVVVSHRVFDNSNGRPLTVDVKIFVRLFNVWYNWRTDAAVIKDKIVSGQVYYFRYEAEGYYPKNVGFLIEKNVGNTNLDVGLFVVPGTLFIDSNEPGLEINIDNKKDDYIGGSVKNFVAFGTTVVGAKDFQLAAGNYTLTISKNKDTVQNLLFRLVNGKETRIGVQYDKQKKSIALIQK